MPGSRNTVTGIVELKRSERKTETDKYKSLRKRKLCKYLHLYDPIRTAPVIFFSKLSSISGYYIVFPVQNDGGRKLVAGGWQQGNETSLHALKSRIPQTYKYIFYSRRYRALHIKLILLDVLRI